MTDNEKRTDKRRVRMLTNIENAVDYMIGTIEIMLYDLNEGDPDREYYEKLSKNHKKLVKTLYDMVMHNVYGRGTILYQCSMTRELRFLGKRWIMNECDKRITNEGY